MIIRTNKHLLIGMPSGSFSGFNPIKTDYSNLIVDDIKKIKGKNLRFSVSDQYNQYVILITANSQEGEKDLDLLESKKDELLGKQFEEVINMDLL